MIFGETIEKETVDYMTVLGRCPMCDADAQIIQSVREVEEHYTTICSNEFYKHYKGESGITYIKKITNPQTRWS